MISVSLNRCETAMTVIGKYTVINGGLPKVEQHSDTTIAF